MPKPRLAIERLEQRFDQMEEITKERFEQVEKRFGQVEKMIRDQAVNTRWMIVTTARYINFLAYPVLEIEGKPGSC